MSTVTVCHACGYPMPTDNRKKPDNGTEATAGAGVPKPEPGPTICPGCTNMGKMSTAKRGY